MKRFLEIVLAMLAWLLAAAAALVASAYFHQSLPIARRVAAARLQLLASSEITGALAIGGIESWGAEGVVFTHVLLFDPDGRRIVRAKRLTMVPALDLDAILNGKIRFSSALLEGGVADLIDDGDGLPTLLSSFDSPHPDPADDDSPPIEVVVDGIQLRQLRLRGDLLGLSGIVARRIDARGRIEIGEEVRVTIEQARGRLVRPFGFEGVVDSLTGTISTEPTEGVDLFAATRRGEQHADAHVIYRAPTKGAADTLDLRVEGDNLAPDTLRGVGFDWLPPLRLPVAGWARLSGPLERLDVEAELTTEAGDAFIIGTLSETDGFDVTIATDGMELAEILDEAPNIRASGSLQVGARPGQDEPTVHAEVDPLAFGRLAVPRMIIDGTLGSDGIRIEKLQTEQRGGLIRGHGRIDDDGSLGFSMSMNVANIAHDENLSKLLPGASGRLQADVRISTPDMASGLISFHGRIVLSNARYGMVSAQRLVLEGSAHGDPERPALKVKVTGKGVRVGEYPLGDAAFAISGGPKRYAASGAFESGGKRTFNLDATITAEQHGFVVDADPVEVIIGEGAWRGVLQGLRIVGKELVELELLRLADRSQRLEASGILRSRGEDNLEAQLQNFDLAAVHAILGDEFALSAGHADATITLTGDVDRPVVMVQGALRDGQLAEVANINALYMVAYEGGRLDVDGEVDLGERGLIRLTGLGHVNPTIADPRVALLQADYDLEVLAEDLTFALVPRLQASGADGKVSASLALRGTAARPRIDGTIEFSPVQLPGWGSFVFLSETHYADGALDMRVSVGDDVGPLGSGNAQLAIDLLSAAKDPAVLERALQQGPWKLSVNTLERRLDRMPGAIALALPYPALISTDIDLGKSHGSTSGTVSFDLGLAEKLPGSACADKVDGRAHGTLALNAGTTRLDARATIGETEVAEIRGMAETPVDTWLARGVLTEPSVFQASVRIDVDEMERVPFLCEFGRGEVSGEIELDGGIAAEPLLIAALEAKFLPRALRPAGARQGAHTDTCVGDPMAVRLDLNADRSEVRIGGALHGCHGGQSTLAGVVPVEWDTLHVLPDVSNERELKLRASFDNAQLKPLLDRIPGVINSRGIARGRVDFSGTVEAVKAAGELDLHDGELYLVATGQRLTGIDASFEFMGNWARLKSLTATAGDGSLSSSGGIAFSGFWPERVQLGLALDDFPVQREGVDLAWLDGHAALDAGIHPDKTRVAIKIHDLTLRLPDSSDRTLQPLEPHPDVIVVTREELELAEPYPIELVIDGTRPFRVLRDDLDMSITAELAVAYLDPKLNIGGQVRFVKGEFEVLGKRFDIESGSMRFNGGDEIDPEIQVLARHQPLTVGAAPIQVSVIGTLSEPEVTFSSEECPGDANAATYLISGRCDVDDPLAAAEAEDAENAFAAGLAGALGGAVTPFLRGEMGGLGPRLALESTGDDARLKAGIVTESLVPKFMRPLVQRVYVQGAVSTEFQDDGLGQAQTASENTISTDLLIEIYFPHNLVGSGKVAPGNWGLDVTWEP